MKLQCKSRLLNNIDTEQQTQLKHQYITQCETGPYMYITRRAKKRPRKLENSRKRSNVSRPAYQQSKLRRGSYTNSTDPRPIPPQISPTTGGQPLPPSPKMICRALRATKPWMDPRIEINLLV